MVFDIRSSEDDKDGSTVIVVGGVVYKPQTEESKEVMDLLRSVYGSLFIEAVYDPYNESTKKFARPLYEEMKRVNEILGFKR